MNRVRLIHCGLAVALVSMSLSAAGADRPKAALRTYQTRYYVIHTDLELDTVREAAARLTAMAEEYHRRTRGFAGVIRKRLGFYLFSNKADYHAAGGPVGSAGVYTGKALMAMAPKKYGDNVWRIVQHEGFHQFAHTVISRRLPVWVDEGLAEYFGHGIWTGDGFVTGVIPPGRLKRVKTMISSGQVMPFMDILMMKRKTWNSHLEMRNYDQAWSMVQFLVHAEEGKYRKALGAFISDIAAHRPWKQAFVNRFGRNVTDFQKRYSEWWLSLSKAPTADLYDKAVVQTLTSFLARAFARGRKFAAAEEFFRLAGEEKLKADSKQWLPPSLLVKALAQASRLKEWSIVSGEQPALILTRADGVKFTGTFSLSSAGVGQIKVTVRRPGPATRPKKHPDKKPSGK